MSFSEAKILNLYENCKYFENNLREHVFEYKIRKQFQQKSRNQQKFPKFFEWFFRKV